MTRAVRALAAVALVLLTGGCLRFRGDLTISGDATVTGTVIAAAKLPSDLPVPVTPPETSNGSGAVRTQPYTEDGYVGTRVVLTRATFPEVERFFADQGGQLVPAVPGLGSATGQDELVARLRIRRDGDDVVVDGRFLFPELADPLGSGRAEKDFQAELVITFPGEVRDTTGSVSGRTVAWTFLPGQAQDVRARAALDRDRNLLLLAALGVLALGLVVAVIGLFRFRATRRPEPAVPEGNPWNASGAPVPPGPGLSRPPTYGGS